MAVKKNYKEPTFDKAGAKAVMNALGASNAGVIKKKSATKKKTTSKKK